MFKVSRRQQGAAEAIESVLRGDKQTSQVIGRRLREIELPLGCSIAAVVRQEKVTMGNPELRLKSGDHVILLLLKRRYVRQIESLFQVNLTFA